MTDADLLLRLNLAVMGVHPTRPPISENPKVHIGMNPVFMTMRSELHHMKKINLKERRHKLLELLKLDYLREEVELRQVGKAFINVNN